jgi:hypothetical protein
MPLRWSKYDKYRAERDTGEDTSEDASDSPEDEDA